MRAHGGQIADFTEVLGVLPRDCPNEQHAPLQDPVTIAEESVAYVRTRGWREGP